MEENARLSAKVDALRREISELRDERDRAYYDLRVLTRELDSHRSTLRADELFDLTDTETGDLPRRRAV